jgi:hypothetical protein
MNSTDKAMLVLFLVGGIFGSILSYGILTYGFGVSAWVSIPLGFIVGLVSPFMV